MTSSITRLFTLVCLFFPAYSSLLYASHGVSIDGVLKYTEDFTQFSYSSEDAQKGGRLVLHNIGSFDKLNPFTLKGEAPYGLENLIYEPLAVSSLDEPFSLYGLLAEDIAIADDQKSVVFTLNGNAKFSDNSPVTAKDVAYTLHILKSDKSHPYYQYYYHDIISSEILGPRRIQLNFSQPNRELHLIAAQMRILPKNHHKMNGFSDVSGVGEMTSLVGSGPYVVSQVNMGKSIIYARNTKYWASDHPTRRGMYNFDEIVVKYYKDQVVALEAFKAGEFDFLSVNIAKQWARDMDGPKFSSGSIIKKMFPHSNNAGMQGFVMNTRREIFKNPLVRRALGLAFDFEWTNKALFYDQYTRSNSFFSNSYLAAEGTPSGLELEYLLPYKDQLPPEVFETSLSAPTTTGKYRVRGNLRKAKRLLAEAGWTVKDGMLVDERGKKFTFDIVLVSSTFERVMAGYVKNLKKLGMRVNYRTIDSALYVERLKSYDYDMIVSTYGQSQSPGNEQRNFWHSSTVDTTGGYNYAGVNSQIVDDLVDKVIYSEKREELIASCKALDRVLWYGYYLVPNWYLAVHRLAYHNKFIIPEKNPVYYNPFQLLMTFSLKDI